MPAWKAGVLPLHQSDIDRLCPFDQEAVSARRYAPGDRMLSPLGEEDGPWWAGAAGGARTHYLTLTTRLLYQLSYDSMTEAVGFEPTHIEV